MDGNSAFATNDYVTAMGSQASASSINMLSDLRGMGGMLLVLGVYVIAATFRAAWRQPAMIVAASIYTTFLGFRSLSLLLDGLPGVEVLMAYAIEAIS